jgi:hypothetical protein
MNFVSMLRSGLAGGIRDAAAFSVPDKFGVETPWIAVVRGADHRPGELMGKLKTRWPLLRGV